MNNTELTEATIKETKLPETDSTKAIMTCVNQAIKGAENLCKCGAFLIPLCVVI